MYKGMVINNNGYSKSDLLLEKDFLGYAVRETDKSMSKKNGETYNKSYKNKKDYMSVAFNQLFTGKSVNGFTATNGVRSEISDFNNNELFAGMLICLLDYTSDRNKENTADVLMMHNNAMRCLDMFFQVDEDRMNNIVGTHEINNPDSLVNNVVRAFIDISLSKDSSLGLSDNKLDKDNFLLSEVVTRLSLNNNDLSMGKGK